MNSLKLLCSFSFGRKMVGIFFKPGNRPVSLFQLEFRNPMGLGAGFDKNAKYLRELDALGFGFVELGTVTPKPQAGNDRPRLFRLPKDKALINRMGFNNDGVEVIAERLRGYRKRNRQQATGNKQSEMSNVRPLITHHSSLIIGGNIGKNKVTPNEEAWKDYEICFKALHPFVDFFVVNVSSPNTPGLRELQEKGSLRKILVHLQSLNAGYEKQRPVLLKIAPDLTWEQIDDVIELAIEIKLDGLVATNTTINKEGLLTSRSEVDHIGAGGLSGRPLKKRSTEIVKYIHQKTSGAIPLIASGGIFTRADAEEKFAAGASLAEVWTGFIYEGPSIVKKIIS